MQVVQHLCLKNTIPSKHQYSHLSLVVNNTTCRLKQKLKCLYRSKFVDIFIKVSFSCFVHFRIYSSKLGYTTCPDLFLVMEDQRYQKTSFSSLKDCSLFAIHTAIVSIIYKASQRMSVLQDVIILSFTTWN